MRTIILYGELAKRFGKYHRMSVANAAEAIRALRANFSGFESYMAGAHHDGVGFRVFVGTAGLRDESEAMNPSGEKDLIRIVPTLFGSGSGWAKIIVGAVLVTVGVIISAASFGGATPLGGFIASIGLSLIFGGVSQLLTSPPDVPGNNETKRKESYIFSGPENTSAQGRPVPVGYGRMIVGSVVISAGIETFDEV